MSADEHVDVTNTFSPEYRETLRRIAEEGECPAPFCKSDADYHKHPFLHQGEYWRVTRNTFNYRDAKHAFLIVYKQHVTNISETSREARLELFEIIDRLVAEFEIPGATLFFRFGEKSRTGASVTHLHCHLVAGHAKTEGGEPVFALVGFAAKKDKED